jgi:MFS family permease
VISAAQGGGKTSNQPRSGGAAPGDTTMGSAPAGLWSRAFVVLCALSFLAGVASAPYGSLLPVYVEADLERLPLFTAYLRAIALVLGGIFAIVGGRMCDLFGLKATLLIGLAGAALTGLVFHNTEVIALTALVLVIGAAQGPTSTAGQSYLITAAGPARLGLGGALYFLSGTLGNSVGSALTGLVKQEWSFPELGSVMTATMCGVVVLGVLLLPATQGQRRQADGSRQRMALWASYRPLLRQPNVHLLLCLRLSITSFWGMATLILPLLIYRVSGSASTTAYYASVSLAFAAGGQLLTGLLRDRFGRRVPLIVSSAGIVISSLCIAGSTDSVTRLFIFGTALTVTAWAVSTLVPALIAEAAAEGEKNRLVGLGHLTWSTAMVTGSLLGGWLVEIDPAVPFLIGAASSSIGTLCAWQLCRRLDQGDA